MNAQQQQPQQSLGQGHFDLLMSAIAASGQQQQQQQQQYMGMQVGHGMNASMSNMLQVSSVSSVTP